MPSIEENRRIMPETMNSAWKRPVVEALVIAVGLFVPAFLSIAYLWGQIDAAGQANDVSALHRTMLHMTGLAFLASALLGGLFLHLRIKYVLAHRYAEVMSRMEKDMLALITQGAPREQVLAGLVQSMEALMPGALCSILLLDKEKKHLLMGAGPSLPDAYNRAIHGVEIGPETGSCGTAAFTGKPVVVSDIQTHPYWQKFRALAGEFGLRSCWSWPVLSTKGEVLGTFAIYHRNVHEPGAAELALSERAGYLVGIAIERSDFEQDLARERNLLRTLIDSIPDVIFIKDRRHRYLAANRAAARFIGVEHESDLTGKTDADLFPAPTATAIQSVEARVLEGKKDVQQESTVVQPDGKVTHLSFSRMPLRDHEDQITGLITIGRDITDQLHVEEERIKTQKLESLGVLAGGIAHDFNNILTSILGNISMIKTSDCRLGHDNEALLKEAEQAVDRARELTQQLLTFAKGGQPIRKPVAVDAVIKEAATLAVRGTACRLELEMAPDLWIASIDAGQISQVIQNLILNAQQAMPGGGTVTIAGRNRTLEAGNRYQLPEGAYLEFVVADNGPGIPPDIIEKIFDPYFTTKPDGNGLGLTSTISIIKKHGGNILADSPPGRGAEFRLVLPAMPEGRPAEAKAAAAPSQVRPARILVMDDEEAILKISAKMLERAGYAALTARSGNDAVRLYQEAKDRGEPIDLVILDLTVPGGMGGKATFEQLKLIDPQVKAVVASGYSMDDIMSRYEFFGFRGVITKPYGRDDLLSAITAALA